MRRRIADGNEWNMPEANLFDGSPLFFFSIFFLFYDTSTFIRNFAISKRIHEIPEIKKGKSD